MNFNFCKTFYGLLIWLNVKFWINPKAPTRFILGRFYQIPSRRFPGSIPNYKPVWFLYFCPIYLI